MGKKKKGELSKYLKELVTFDINLGEPIKDDEQKKFVFHSMILNLDDVNTLYDFFKDFLEEFTTSK
jgi:phosphoribosyl-dephospho-CoA transferase